ncbi:GNAT family N-acetyltransferase [Curtobacterium sp. 18060]|uniref:GNAT family N-acetyltransferase n=1 Tax=Curtobacterium sp. 18060 TaxID=2681408 RepID=UPI001359FE13|nr:GNAT family N-acetyltransferase [Curtobacterium sp. 18060]
MTAISVRRAVRSDVAAVQTVGLLTWPPTYLAFTSPDHVLCGLAAWWSADAVLATITRDTTFVAEIGDRVVGTATLGTEPVIWKLYVVPDQQGTGSGHALIQAMLDTVGPSAIGHRPSAVFVEFIEGNDWARRFYERHGFGPDRVEHEECEPATVWFRRPEQGPPAHVRG